MNGKDERQKSIQLLKLLGWHPVIMPKNHSEGSYRLADEKGNWNPWSSAYPTPESAWSDAPNLYEPSHMAMAWRVLNWAMAQSFWSEVNHYLGSSLFAAPPKEAQTFWLDTILRLAEERAY